MKLSAFLMSWIHFSKLSILGINEIYVFGLMMLCGLLAIYLIIEPIIGWLVIAGSRKTISYFLSTLLLLVLLTLFLTWNDSLRHLAVDLLKIAFTSFSIFGVILAVSHFIKDKVFKRKKTY